MALGITNVTSVNISTITEIANVTDPMDFFRNVNTTVYSGFLYFILLAVLFFILYFTLNKVVDQPLNSIMFAGAICSVTGFVLRGLALLSANQVWIFPIITIIAALIVWFTKD